MPRLTFTLLSLALASSCLPRAAISDRGACLDLAPDDAECRAGLATAKESISAGGGGGYLRARP
jgi:hypothetical protein